MFFKKKKSYTESPSLSKNDITSNSINYVEQEQFYLVSFNFFVERFDYLISLFDEIQLETKLGFTPEMSDLITEAISEVNSLQDIYSSSISDLDVNSLGSIYRKIHKKIVLSNTSVSESLKGMLEATNSQSVDQFHEELKNAMDGLNLGMEAIKDRNDL